jgi:excisionase family DNA binding protein
MKPEKLADALIAELKGKFDQTPQGWAALKKRFVAIIEKESAPGAPIAASLAETEKALEGGQLYTTHDVARLLQVDPSTVSKWIDRKVLMAFRTPGGHRRVRAADLREFCAKHQIPITGELAA